MTVTMLGYRILADFLRFYFLVFLLLFVSIEKIYLTLTIVFVQILKRLEVRQIYKYNATRRFFNFLFH